MTTFDTQVLLRRAGRTGPFDRFVVDPLVVTAVTGSGSDVQAPSTGARRWGSRGLDRRRRRALGGRPDVQEDAWRCQRSGGILVYSALLLAMMVILAALAAFVSIQTARTPPRRATPTLLGWMAAMVFAVIPMRTSCPARPDRRLGRHHRPRYG
ncbi:DUF4436 domain-containing protein [Rhodococcus hoagii]|nr:DUF4436 domain-containing protein [Prescottella equi]